MNNDYPLPIWWCIVRDEPTPTYLQCLHVIKAIPTTLDQIDRLYREHVALFSPHFAGRIPSVMLFHREPENTPITDRFERDTQ